jgi:hypothetical protein
MPEELSLAEKMIFNIAGEKGVELYRIADGRTTIEDAAKLLKLDVREVEEILKKIEKFVRIEIEIEEKKEEKLTVKKITEPLFIPEKISSLSFIDLTQLTIEFGPTGRNIYESLGKKDVAELAVENNLTLEETDKILIWLHEKKILKYKILDEKDIKNKYGSIGLKLYQLFERKGPYLYLLLEKTNDPIKAIRISKLENAIDIMEYIFKLLSPPITFDKEEIMEQLEQG